MSDWGVRLFLYFIRELKSVSIKHKNTATFSLAAEVRSHQKHDRFITLRIPARQSERSDQVIVSSGLKGPVLIMPFFAYVNLIVKQFLHHRFNFLRTFRKLHPSVVEQSKKDRGHLCLWKLYLNTVVAGINAAGEVTFADVCMR